eukprot:5426664-Prymnesium_polylepis.1
MPRHTRTRICDRWGQRLRIHPSGLWLGSAKAAACAAHLFAPGCGFQLQALGVSTFERDVILFHTAAHRTYISHWALCAPDSRR